MVWTGFNFKWTIFSAAYQSGQTSKKQDIKAVKYVYIQVNDDSEVMKLGLLHQSMFLKICSHPSWYKEEGTRRSVCYWWSLCSEQLNAVAPL